VKELLVRPFRTRYCEQGETVLLIKLTAACRYHITEKHATVQVRRTQCKSQDSTLCSRRRLQLVFTKRCKRGSFKHLSYAFSSPRRTLDISIGLDECCHLLALFYRHRLLLAPRKILDYGRISSEVLLCADENNGHLGAEMRNFGQPLVDDVGQAGGIGNAEAD